MFENCQHEKEACSSQPPKLMFTDDGSLVIYICLDSEGNPKYVTSDERMANLIGTPFSVEYIKYKKK